MGTFNYSRFRYFDKNGNELIINNKAAVKITINNQKYPDFNSEYAFVNGDPTLSDVVSNSSMIKIKSGMRYGITDSSATIPVHIKLNNDDYISDAYLRNTSSYTSYRVIEYPSSNGTDNYPELLYNESDDATKAIILGANNLALDTSVNLFPTYTFESRICFDKISTGLIETQTIYVLVENENKLDDEGIPMFTTVKEYAETNADASAYINRYKLFFFIDCRDQKDFRMFNVKYDEMEWSDRSTIDFTKQYEDGVSDNGYSVNVGFSGENDGVYEQKMYICILDTSTASENYPGDVYPVGEILMCAETEGEDERYRTLFTNFGIPDPKEYNYIFNDTDQSEELPDYVSINRHSKKMFLTYSEIFPYVGSYKALINAVKLLGYEDEVFFKEWYKEIGTAAIDDNRYTTYDITYGSKINRNVIENSLISDRIHLRKMNWISMIYKLSTEMNGPDDMYGFPPAITKYSNYNTDKLMKLFGLKKWLEKYIIGVNCHITDISGEGIVFERYNLPKFGTYQTVIDYTNEKAISPVFVNDVTVLDDGSANIGIDIYTSDNMMTIEECGNITFENYCEGYFNQSGVFCKYSYDATNDSSLCRYFGKTFELNDNIDSFLIRLRGKHDSYLMNHENADLLINDNKISFYYNPYGNDVDYNITFDKPPVIEIKEGTIKKYANDKDNTGDFEYYATIYQDTSNGEIQYNINVSNSDVSTDIKIYTVDDVPTLLPPEHIFTENKSKIDIIPASNRIYGDIATITKYVSRPYEISLDSGESITYNNINSVNTGLRYCIDNTHGIPCFKIIGYEERQLLLDNKEIFPKMFDNNGEGNEYFIEILEGKMIFNNNGAMSVINFTHKNGEKKIYVTTYKDEQYSSTYNYRTGEDEYVNRFNFGQDYDRFISYYDENAEDAVIYDNTKQVNVENCGEYEVCALMYDNNNVFSKTSDRKCKVITQSAEINILTADQNSNNSYDVYGKPISSTLNKYVISSMIDNGGECNFGYEPKMQITSRDDYRINYNGVQQENRGYTKDNGVNIVNNKKNYSKATISSMSDRFDLVGKVQKTVSETNVSALDLIRKTTHNSHIFCDDTKDLSNILKYYGIDESLGIMDILDLLLYFADVENIDTMADATIFLYDSLYEYPLISVPGVMLPVKNSEYDEYRFMPADQTQTDVIMNIVTNYGSSKSSDKIRIYVIPTWVLKCDVVRLSSSYEDDTISLNINNYPFDTNIPVNSMCTLSFKTAYDASNNNPYCGYGSYRIKDVIDAKSDNENKTKSTKKLVTLDAALYDGQDRPYFETAGFDGSTWFSSNSLDFMEYRFDVSTAASDNTKGYVEIKHDANSMRIKPFIDNQYSISLRDFDTLYAMMLWDWDNDSYDDSFEAQYTYDVPVKLNNPYIAIVPMINSDRAYMISDDIIEEYPKCMIKWKVYRRTDEFNRTLVMECYNNMLYMKVFDKGVYDVELDFFDRNGNKYTKKMYNAFTY